MPDEVAWHYYFTLTALLKKECFALSYKFILSMLVTMGKKQTNSEKKVGSIYTSKTWHQTLQESCSLNLGVRAVASATHHEKLRPSDVLEITTSLNWTGKSYN